MSRSRVPRRLAALLVAALVLTATDPTPLTAASSDLAVAPDRRHLIHRETGEPFVWLGDTAWSATKQLSPEEMDAYLDLRQQQGFTVIQVILIGHDPGPNRDGHWPFHKPWDAARPLIHEGPDNDFWDRTDYFIEGAIARGMYVLALPVWRKHVHEAPFICKDKTYAYGRFLGERYRRLNAKIVWCMGGDMYVDHRHCHDASHDIYHNLARGLAVGVLGSEDYERMAMTYHIIGPHATTEIEQLRNAPWRAANGVRPLHVTFLWRSGELPRALPPAVPWRGDP